jgi:hypothetical protein
MFNSFVLDTDDHWLIMSTILSCDTTWSKFLPIYAGWQNGHINWCISSNVFGLWLVLKIHYFFWSLNMYTYTVKICFVHGFSCVLHFYQKDVEIYMRIRTPYIYSQVKGLYFTDILKHKWHKLRSQSAKPTQAWVCDFHVHYLKCVKRKEISKVWRDIHLEQGYVGWWWQLY